LRDLPLVFGVLDRMGQVVHDWSLRPVTVADVVTV
jgi:hypothetical protein